MKIAMVSEHASPLAVLGDVDAGGQNVYVAALARACARQGHRVVVYTRRDGTRFPDRVPFAPGVTIVHLRAGPPRPIAKDEIYPFVPEMAAQLLGEWSYDPPDVVHAHFWMSGLAAQLAANPTGIPVAMTFHALGRTKRAWQGTADSSPDARITEEEFLARTCDRLIATAKHEMFELRAMGAPRKRIVRVPCGVDLSRFRPLGPIAEAPPRRQRYRLLCVSRLVERKGIDTVIDALPALPDTELLVAGGPGHRDLLKDAEARRLVERARAVHVADRVTLLGQVGQDALPALYRSADLVVCTPWYEPFGMVAVEAMACGVPVVATGVGGLLDTVVDGKTGLHVDPRDSEAVAAAARALLRDDARRASLGAQAAARVRAQYGWDTVAAEMSRTYRAMQRTSRQRRYA